MPRAGEGIHLFAGEGEVGAHGCSGNGAEERYAINAAAVPGDVFLKAPSEAAENVYLSVQRLAVPVMALRNNHNGAVEHRAAKNTASSGWRPRSDA